MTSPAKLAPGVLRAVLTTMCLTTLWWNLVEPDELSGLLLVDLAWCSETTADGISRAGAVLYGLAGLLLWTPLARPAALWVAAWTLLLMGVHMAKDPYWPETTPGAWAVRWLGPLALWAWLGRRRRGEDAPGPWVEWSLRVAAASTFVFHGAKAFGLLPFSGELVAPNAEYLDFLATLHDRLFGDSLAQADGERMLRAVGVLDLAVATMLLVGRFWVIALWMTLWGFFTAALRLLEYEGTGTGPMRFLIRAPNGGVPLVLLLLWLRPAPARPYNDPATAAPDTSNPEPSA